MNNWIWLSHVLNERTPAYGGGPELKIIADKKISQGDTCNTVQLVMPNHIGTHVDAPKHFIDQGKTIDEYSPQEWVFCKPLLIDVPITDAVIISVSDIEFALDGLIIEDADIVMVRTGMEAYRNSVRYRNQYPGFSPDLCGWLRKRFSSFSVLGMDTISISSVAHRGVGREAHQAFLGDGIRIIEDISLSKIPNANSLKRVIAMPLRYSSGDGAPIIMMGEISH